jgi:hypothetical protein
LKRDSTHAVAPANGGRALIVNVVDAEAQAFWGRRGFIPSKDDRSSFQVDRRHCGIASLKPSSQ